MGKPPEGPALQADTPVRGDNQQGPRGIGTGVTFDWALAVQLLIGAITTALGIPSASDGHASIGLRVGLAAAFIVAAALVTAQGEALRRGRRVAWRLQVAFNALLVLDGLGELPRTLAALQVGHVGQLAREIVLLIISPLLVWLLTRPSTRAWVNTTTASAAATRHGGRWIVQIALFAVISGAAIAFAPYY